MKAIFVDWEVNSNVVLTLELCGRIQASNRNSSQNISENYDVHLTMFTPSSSYTHYQEERLRVDYIKQMTGQLLLVLIHESTNCDT